ncbi:hypothetical protein Tco_1435830 [Tanacetum coccineum]
MYVVKLKLTDTEMKDASDPNDSEKGVMPDENLNGALVDAEMGNTPVATHELRPLLRMVSSSRWHQLWNPSQPTEYDSKKQQCSSTRMHLCAENVTQLLHSTTINKIVAALYRRTQ